MKTKKIFASLLAAVLTLSSVNMNVHAATMSGKPEDGITNNQPFLPGTGGSDGFRIPCLVSLDDGTLVAAADARWNTYGDGGGLDTIVSHSKDDGGTWNYTFANYLGDNGNTHNKASTAFIDPSIATDGKNVYMIADLYPGGYALNGADRTPSSGKSHDDNGNILLVDVREWNGQVYKDERKDPSSYQYHLAKKANPTVEDTYEIRKNDDQSVVEGLTIDAYFNITEGNHKVNLFEKTAPFQVWPTDYLYFTKSADAGKTWSTPSILNVRNENEQAYLVGPGRGLYTSNGRLIFTAYYVNNGEKTSTIYSDDQGVTWKRGETLSHESSEAAITEANGKLFMFTRYGGYYVSTDNGHSWSAQKNVGLDYNLKCEISAVTYPQKIDGKTAIILTVPDRDPSNQWTRKSGNMFIGLVNEDDSIEWKYKNKINGDAFFAYSCLTILPDGSIGLLYESNSTELTYKNYKIEDMAKGAVIGDIWCSKDNQLVPTLTMKSNSHEELTIHGLSTRATSEQVSVSTDNDVCTPSIVDGKLRLVTKQLNGLQKANIKLTAGNKTTTLHVVMTDEDNYQFIDLTIGGSKQVIDETGNYANDTLEGLNENIASVDRVGKDAITVKRVSKAQLGSSIKENVCQFNGEKVDLDSLLLTFKHRSNNRYHISGQVNGITVYLTPKTAAQANKPFTTESYEVQALNDNGTFGFKQVTGSLPSAPNNGANLAFVSSKKLFDRQGTASQVFTLFKKDVTSKDGPIIGYKQVTSIEAGGRYLVTVKDGSDYYVLTPSKGNNGYEYISKVVTEEVQAVSEATVQLVDKSQNNAFVGDIQPISYNLFTFDKLENGYFNIYSDIMSVRRYLAPYSGADVGSGIAPLTSNAESIEVAKNGESFTFKQVSSNSNGNSGRYLYFHRPGHQLYYDRQNSVDNSCKFDIFKPDANARGSGIIGYSRVTDVSQIESGKKYLIAAKAADNNYYVLNTANTNFRYDYVAKVTGELMNNASTTITFKGKSEGETSVKIGQMMYYITVKNKEEKLTLTEEDTYVLPHKYVSMDKQGIVELKESQTLPPYKAVDTIKLGQYVFGLDGYIMVNKATGGNPQGLALQAANYNTNDYSQYIWTVEKVNGVDNGYTMKDVNNQYVHIDGKNVTLSSEPQTLTITKRNNGGFSVSAGNMYLNDYAESKNKVAAWNTSDNPWKFFKPSVREVLLAKKAGQVKVVTEGVNYIITVRAKPCKHTSDQGTITKEATCLDTGIKTYTCTKCHEELRTEVIPALGHDYGEWVVIKPTCTVEGSKTKTCARCDNAITEAIPALGHQVSHQGQIDATCDKDGHTGNDVCDVCGEVVKKGEVIPALGHDYGEWVVVTPATDEHVGKEVRTCKRQGCTHQEERVIPQLPVNKEELKALIDKALAYDLDLYTLDTVEQLKEAIQQGRKVYNNNNATKQEVNQATTTLMSAIEGLKEKVVVDIEKLVDFNQLITVLNQATAIKPNGYTQESYQVLTDMIVKAQKLYQSKPTQKEIDAMVIDLQTAIDGLKKESVMIPTSDNTPLALAIVVLSISLLGVMLTLRKRED